MKRLLSVILALAMVLSLVVAIATINVSADAYDGTAATAFAGGDGTKDNPYQIATAAQLKYLSDLVNGEETNVDYNGLYYKLTADLDLGGQAWEPIGNSLTFYFAGDFDGDNHTISNFRIVNEQFAGLFGVAVGSIKNIKVERATITSEGVPVKAAGFIVGQVIDSVAALEVSNCVVGKGTSMNVSTVAVSPNKDNEHRLGGIVGNGPRDFELNISNCINYSTIVLNNASCGDAAVAGITSFIRLGSVKNCVNFGKMVSKEDFQKIVWVGGIIGGILSPAKDPAIVVTVENCINYGDLSGGWGTGGIIGTLHSSGKGKVVITNAFSLAEKIETITYLASGEKIGGALIGVGKHDGSMTNVKAFKCAGANITGAAVEIAAFGPEYDGSIVEGYEDAAALASDKATIQALMEYSAILTALGIDETDFPNPDEVVPGPDDPDAAPETNAPETNAPETNAPETNAPETNAPETNAPETNAPETNAPGTEAPGTDKPEEKGGCGSVVAGGLAILAVVALAGIALKKRD